MEQDPVKREHPRPKSGFHRIIFCSVHFCGTLNLCETLKLRKALKLRKTLHLVQFWNPGNPVKSLIELHKRQEVYIKQIEKTT